MAAAVGLRVVPAPTEMQAECEGYTHYGACQRDIPDCAPAGARPCLIVPFDNVLCGGHLMPVFGEEWALNSLHVSEILETLKLYYLCKLLNRHANNIAF